VDYGSFSLSLFYLSLRLIWQISLLEVGEALDEVALRMLRLGMLLALCFRGGADESLHAYLALHWEGSIDQIPGNTKQCFLVERQNITSSLR